LTEQLLTKQASPAGTAWSRLFVTYQAVTRELNERLSAEHGLSLSELEVLLHLARAPERSMRRVDLANEVLLSPSGITRLLNRLAEDGLVGSRACPSDARVTWAVLTDKGAETLDLAFEVQRAILERLLGDQLSASELETLSELLGRLPGSDEDCDLPDSD
jgi:DNA-binding MarR family transcriptional regulator